MIIDKVEIEVTSGKGGDGAVSFLREKFMPNGGPDGGDGGRGGSVILMATEAVSTLGDYRYTKKFKAPDGENGSSKNRSGKAAADLVIKVPVGTLIFEGGRAVADLVAEGESYTAARGGRGGNGNQHYALATRQAPKFAKPGDEAITKKLTLELKMLADVGLVGFPNVGKSTLLSMVSNAKPKIANYHFTTLYPNLGMVRYRDSEEFVMADIPGLIEGAGEGVGLGSEFLRHIERTRLLVHVLDAAGSEGRDPKEDFEKINRELEVYSPRLMERQQIVMLNKADIVPPEERYKLDELKEYFEKKGHKTFITSAASNEGLTALLICIVQTLPTIEYEPLFFTKEEIEERVYEQENDSFEIVKEDGAFFVTGKMMERIMKTVNLEDYESLAYFQRLLKNKGVFSALEKAGVKEGDTVSIEGFEFEYYK
ncbi:MAG: GTPase ObgE [Eubacteriaceae bacterium]|nr:GTPase ObgE [Eubacteriaceae bacterium]